MKIQIPGTVDAMRPMVEVTTFEPTHEGDVRVIGHDGNGEGYWCLTPEEAGAALRARFDLLDAGDFRSHLVELDEIADTIKEMNL